MVVVFIVNPMELKIQELSTASCQDRDGQLKRLAGDGKWTLSPLHYVFGHIHSDASENMSVALWNIVLIATIALFQFGSIFIASRFSGSSPYILFPAITFAMQGTSHGSIGVLLEGDTGAWILVGIVGLTLCLSVVAYSVWWLRTNEYAWQMYDAAVVSSSVLRRVFLPRGVWDSTRHGVERSLYNSTTPGNEYYYPTHMSFIIMLGGLTAINTTSAANCQVIVGMTAALLFAASLLMLYRRPLRNLSSNLAQVVTFGFQGLLVLGEFAFDELELLVLVLSTSITLDTVTFFIANAWGSSMVRALSPIITCM
jgi:hypothetical protein